MDPPVCGEIAWNGLGVVTVGGGGEGTHTVCAFAGGEEELCSPGTD